MDEIKTLLRLMLGMDGYIPSAEELLRKQATFYCWWRKLFSKSEMPFLFSHYHLMRETLLDHIRAYGTVITIPLG